MSKLDHAASLISSDAASTRKATLQHRTTNRKSINTCYDASYLRRKVANNINKQWATLFPDGWRHSITPRTMAPFTSTRKLPANPLRGRKRLWYQRMYLRNGNNSYTEESRGIPAGTAAAEKNTGAGRSFSGGNCRIA